MTALYIVLGLLVLLAAVLVIRTVRCRPAPAGTPAAGAEPVDEEGMAQRLAGALRYRTISRPDPVDMDESQFLDFHQYLQDRYPLIHRHLSRETVAGLSLLYRWEGTEPDLKPLALLSHMDVVPVMPGTEADWEHDPFGGDVDGQFIWGRGAMDMKNHLVAVMEAVEHLLKAGYRPRRDIYLCFGHNEEVVGADAGGALTIMRTLKDRGITLECIIDEGGMVTSGETFGIDNPVAMVGIAEKGYMDVEMVLNHPGGHSSQPPASTGLGRMAAAIVRLERSPFPVRMTRPVASMFEALAPYTGFGMRLVLANGWLLRPVLLSALAKKPLTNAMVRTTTAATMAQGSPAANVLPQITRFTVNCRILPGETIAGTLERMKRICADDGIEFKVMRGKEPSAVAPIDSPSWHILRQTIGEFFGGSLVAPYLMVGGTDSCAYEPICRNIYRFGPIQADTADLGRIHGTNERISRENLVRSVRFFMRFIRSMNEG